MAQVLALARRVEAHAGAERRLVGAHRHLARLAVLDALDRERLVAREPQRVGSLAVEELLYDEGRVAGVRANGGLELRASLVIGDDGEVTDESTAQFLRHYMDEYCAFVQRVLAVGAPGHIGDPDDPNAASR